MKQYTIKIAIIMLIAAIAFALTVAMSLEAPQSSLGTGDYQDNANTAYNQELP